MALVKKICLSLLACAALAAPTGASPEDENTLVINLPGLPPASTSPPRATHPGYPAHQQPPVAAPPPSSALRRDLVGRLGICEWHGAPIYRGRDGGGRMLARVAQGTPLAIKSDYGAWYAVMMIDGSLGWIQKNAVRLLDYNVVRREADPPQSPSAGSSALAEIVLAKAQEYLGVPYVWGGNGRRGLDCSGLVKNCFARAGLPLPRRASQQARVGQPVPLNVAELQPGDRLYFAVKGSAIDHTGIYLGNGYFIHASMSRGEVAVDPLSKPLYSRHWVAARRS
jgi:hypothetical protein